MSFCTKCGKEIPEGENKLCEDCRKKLITDIETENVEESKFEIAKEQNLEKDKKDKKNKKSKEKEKDSKEEKNKKIGKKILIAVIILLVVIGILIAEFTTKCFSKLILGNDKPGTTIGNNNNNFGYANIHGNWIYYMTLSDDVSKININRVKNDGTSKEMIAQDDWEIYSINVYKDYLYFIAYEEPEDENTSLNNKIYKMSLDGKELIVINDNQFSDDCKNIYVVNNRVYYIGENYNIYSMDLFGGDRTLVSDNKTGFIGITNKYIIYNDYPENPQSQTDFVTYIMNIDGTNSKEITGERLYNPNIIDDQVYYVNAENSEIHRVDVNGKNDIVIYKSPAYNMNVSGEYIYYINYKNENADSEDEPVCIHRIKLDGSDHKVVCEMQNYTSFINIVGDWIYYTDHDETNYYMKMIKSDGTNPVTLYHFDMSSQNINQEETQEQEQETSREKTQEKTQEKTKGN